MDKLVITLSGEQSSKEKEVTTEEYIKGLENFVSLVKTKKALNICKEPSAKKMVKILTNDHIKCSELVAPCSFQTQLKVSKVREVKVVYYWRPREIPRNICTC